jgi:mannosylglycerate hydrolase
MPSNGKNELKVYVISHTHWDREWYQTFQGYRARLVGLLDELLEFMEKNPAFAYYHLDGQTIVLEDYLEIRPENRSRLQQLITAGRIIPGPWYVMPDEFLVSGEAMIRNLQMGYAICRAWGVEPMKSGYLVDIFGHNSQMPQVLLGFGIDSAVAFRGVSTTESSAEFIWEGADGSSVIFYRLPDRTAYSNFFYDVRLAQLSEDRFDVDRGCADFLTLIESEKARSNTGVLLIMDGVDHLEILPELPELMDRARTALPEARIIHGRLEDYHRENLKHKHRLPVHGGELRIPRRASSTLSELLANVLSSRIHLKQRNVLAQVTLERLAEPWAVCAESAGRKAIARYFDVAWRYLIQNHPHDSICGCSIDQVHTDMRYRFDQSLQISARLAGESVEAIHAAVKPPSDGEYLVSVFNPSPFARHGVLVDVEFPDHFAEAFGLNLRDGTPVPYQHVSVQKRMKLLRPFRNMPSAALRATHTVFADVTVPALGYTTLVYKHAAPESGPEAEGSIMKGPTVLENDLIRLAFQSDGTVTLTELASGEEYSGLHTFEDRGDTGDGWRCVPPANDRIIATMSGVSIAVTANGPLTATAVVSGVVTVPAGLSSDQTGRSQVIVSLRITSTFTIRRGSRRVDVRTEMENNARDHVLKVLFSARVVSRESFADSMFDVVRRDIRLPSNVGFVEPWQENRPLWSFVGISDPRRGLAVFSKGLHEGGVREDDNQSVFLTILRCFGKTVFTLGEEGGQMPGPQTAEYAFMPVHDGELPAVLAENDLFQNPVMCCQSLDVFKNRYAGTLDDTRSFLSISDQRVVLSSLRRNPRGDLVLRVFNPTPDTVAADVVFGFPVSRVTETDLEEATTGTELELAKDRIRLQLKPKAIQTLLLG